MAKVISFVNHKGGVGKTSITVMLGEFLSEVHGKKVLIIDLDPQTNATLMLIGENQWFELKDKGFTLYSLFYQAIYEQKCFNLQNTIQKKVGDVESVNTLDLIPSNIELVFFQDNLAPKKYSKLSDFELLTILQQGVGTVFGKYDYVLIDCPPSLGLLSLNGLFISDAYIIPTIPDHLSTWGVPQIIRRISRLSDFKAKIIKPSGIIITKYQPASPVHRDEIKALQGYWPQYPRVFDTKVHQLAAIAGAGKYHDTRYLTLRRKYSAPPFLFDDLKNLCDEFIGAV